MGKLALWLSGNKAKFMYLQNLPNLTLQEAHKILKVFDCLDSQSAELAPSQAVVRQALLLTVSHSEYQILGICATTASEGISALKTYAQALGYQAPLEESTLRGPVYIKFNPSKGLCYVDSYLGNHRGVLVSCQSSQSGGINELYGHLPIDLFMSNL